MLAVETVPPGLPPETPLVLPSAELLLARAAANLMPPPLEPIYLRPVSITLPKAAAAATQPTRL